MKQAFAIRPTCLVQPKISQSISLQPELISKNSSARHQTIVQLLTRNAWIPDSAKDPSPTLPKGQGNEANKLEASGDSTAKPEVSPVDNSPDSSTIGDEGGEHTKDVTTKKARMF
jgi:hypothetical protein